MKKNITSLVLLCCYFALVQSQENTRPFLSDAYLSVEGNYRSYGTGDLVGIGLGFELSKDIKKWLGVGVNLSYWSNQRQSWDFYDPLTLTEFDYFDQISELKIAPFVQFIPINTKHIDFYIQTGLRFGHYNQVRQGGGFVTDTSITPNQVLSFVQDEGDKGVNLGYEIGIALRLQFGSIIVVPSSTFSNDFNLNDYSSLNLKVGWQLP